MKKCNKCNELKENSEFYKNKKSKDGLLGWCKVCERNRKLQYYTNNTEVCKERRKNYREANPGKVKLCKSNSYFKHHDKNLKKNKQYYATTDKAKYHVYATNRRGAKISTSDGTITEESLDVLMKVQDNLCFYCNEDLSKLPSNKKHLDHYIPLSKKGIHSIGNVVWSCASCNFHKHNSTPNKPLTFKIKDKTSKIQSS